MERQGARYGWKDGEHRADEKYGVAGKRVAEVGLRIVSQSAHPEREPSPRSNQPIRRRDHVLGETSSLDCHPWDIGLNTSDCGTAQKIFRFPNDEIKR